MARIFKTTRGRFFVGAWLVTCVIVAAMSAYITTGIVHGGNTHDYTRDLVRIRAQMANLANAVADSRCAWRVYEDLSVEYQRDDLTRDVCWGKVVTYRYVPAQGMPHIRLR